jgi:integrase
LIEVVDKRTIGFSPFGLCRRRRGFGVLLPFHTISIERRGPGAASAAAVVQAGNPRPYVTAEQLPKFHSAICDLPSPIARDYLLLLLFTGLRRNEAASLTCPDVDLHEKVLRIPASRTKPGRKLDLPMTDVVFDLFTEGSRAGRDKFVFPSNSKVGYIAEPKFPFCKSHWPEGYR